MVICWMAILRMVRLWVSLEEPVGIEEVVDLILIHIHHRHTLRGKTQLLTTTHRLWLHTNTSNTRSGKIYMHRYTRGA